MLGGYRSPAQGIHDLDIKSLSVGIVVGVVVGAIAAWTIQNPTETEERDETRPVPAASQPSEETAHFDEQDVGIENQRQAGRTSHDPAYSIAGPKAAPAQQQARGFPENEIVMPPVQAIQIAPTHRSLISEGAVPDRNSGSPSEIHAALEAEDVDEGWSHYMEQNLQMFLGAQPEANQFNIASIICRSTMCEVQAIGYDEATGHTWSGVMLRLRSQPWYEFGETGSWSSTMDGGLAIVTILKRNGY